MNIAQTILITLTGLLTFLSGPTTYTEGIIGQPQTIHPIYSQENPINQGLTTLIFEGLTRIDRNGEIVPGLAESWEISEDKKTYIFKLNPQAQFHNGKPVTAKDVLHTASQSPALQKIKLEEIDSQTIKVELKTPFAPLLRLFSIGIVPKPEKGPFGGEREIDPLIPIGAGTYRIKRVEKGTRTVELIVLEKFKENRPGPQKIFLKFFETEEELQISAQLGEIDAFASENSTLSNFSSPETVLKGRYFSLLFNLAGGELPRNIDFRRTLAHLTDRGRIINNALEGRGAPSYGPLQNTWAKTELEPTKYNPESSENWSGEIELLYPDSKNHSETAHILKSDWEKTGITVNLKAAPPEELKTTILPQKQFEIILIGQEVGRDPDCYPLWHSTQVESSSNFAGYQNMRADCALEKGRKEHDLEKRKEHYKNFQDIFMADLPAIFLYQPTYTYHLKKTKGDLDLEGIFTPSERWERILEMYP